MPKKETCKLDRDDLINAFREERILDALTERLMVTIEWIAKRTVDAETKALKESVSALKNKNEHLRERLDQLEIYSRADNLIIHGIGYRRGSTRSETFSGWAAAEGESRKEKILLQALI